MALGVRLRRKVQAQTGLTSRLPRRRVRPVRCQKNKECSGSRLKIISGSVVDATCPACSSPGRRLGRGSLGMCRDCSRRCYERCGSLERFHNRSRNGGSDAQPPHFWSHPVRARSACLHRLQATNQSGGNRPTLGRRQVGLVVTLRDPSS